MDVIEAGVRAALTLIVQGDPALIEIAMRSLGISLAATGLAALVGIPLGMLLRVKRFAAKGVATLVVHTGMGLPPVLVGLVISLLLWRTGPLGALQLLYTPLAMTLAQFIVAMPLVAGLTHSALTLLEPELLEALRMDGAGDLQAGGELVRAALPQVVLAVLAGFGRAIAEVGASMMVGGNLVGQTRILTTAITLETNRGDFALAIALGLILLLLALVLNGLARTLSA
jgi:tungstate transport system permease protein